MRMSSSCGCEDRNDDQNIEDAQGSTRLSFRHGRFLGPSFLRLSSQIELMDSFFHRQTQGYGK
jgi:hypothetical protein